MKTVYEVSKLIDVSVSWIHHRLTDFSDEGFDISSHQGKQGSHMTLDDVLIDKLKERRDNS